MNNICPLCKLPSENLKSINNQQSKDLFIDFNPQFDRGSVRFNCLNCSPNNHIIISHFNSKSSDFISYIKDNFYIQIHFKYPNIINMSKVDFYKWNGIMWSYEPDDTTVCQKLKDIIEYNEDKPEKVINQYLNDYLNGILFS